MKIQPWFNEWEETFEFVQCKPELSFLPMEVSGVKCEQRVIVKSERIKSEMYHEHISTLLSTLHFPSCLVRVPTHLNVYNL